MKIRDVILPICGILSTCLAPTTSKASHAMGGEITWTCNGTDYVFELRFYRDCNGIPGPQSITLHSDHPTVSSIPMTLVSQTDITPTGSNTSGITPCVTCPMANNSPGSAEMFVFQSNPVALPGVPPAGGWNFWWWGCCRAGWLTNVFNGGSYGYTYRATMYPFSGQTPGQCLDASPYFMEPPPTVACTGIPLFYDYFARDTDLDSLVYAFDSLYNQATAPPFSSVAFAPGYSLTSPFPGPAQNPLNIPASIDPASGLVSLTSFTQGYFATDIKVQAFKCGQLVAEIFREMNIQIITGCAIPVVPQVPNNSPTLTGVMDTIVHAGDSLHLVFASIDSDPNPLAGVQHVFLSSTSEQYGSGDTSTTSGCLIPPCAILTPPPPVSAPGGTSMVFDWETTTAHLGINFGCVYLGNIYYFLVKVHDDFCPANANNMQLMKVTVIPNTPVPPVSSMGGTLTCLLFTGNYTYQWFKDRFAIPGATGQSYTPVSTGFYQVLAFDPQTGDGNYSTGIQVNVTGLPEQAYGLSGVSVFPNPTTDGSFSVSLQSASKQEVAVRVTDVTGRTVYSSVESIAPGNYRKNIALAVPAGVYIVSLDHAGGTLTRKIVLL